MWHGVEIENIEEMRRQAGIDDIELREDIRQLQVGDCVKLTFMTDSDRLRSETLLVLITNINGDNYQGKLAETPKLLGTAKVQEGSVVKFKKDHIHSIAKRSPRAEQ